MLNWVYDIPSSTHVYYILVLETDTGHIPVHLALCTGHTPVTVHWYWAHTWTLILGTKLVLDIGTGHIHDTGHVGTGHTPGTRHWYWAHTWYWARGYWAHTWYWAGREGVKRPGPGEGVSPVSWMEMEDKVKMPEGENLPNMIGFVPGQGRGCQIWFVKYFKYGQIWEYKYFKYGRIFQIWLVKYFRWL